MATIAGNSADLGIAFQSAKGTPATAAAFRTFLTGGGVNAVREQEDIAETAAGRLRSDSYVTQIRGEGSPAFAVRPAIIGAALYAAMGAKAVTGASDPYTHTFTLAPTQPWMTLFKRLGPAGGTGLYERLSDAKATSLAIASGAGGIMTATLGVLAARVNSLAAAEAAVAAESGAAFLHAHGAGAMKIEGTAVSIIESVTCTIGTGAAAIQTSDVTPETVVEGMQDVTIETTELIQDFALWNRLIYGTATPADLTPPVATPLELAGSPAGIDFKWTLQGTPERSLEILAPRVQVSIPPTEPNVGGDPLRRTVTYRVYQPAGGVSGLTAKLKNAVTTY